MNRQILILGLGLGLGLAGPSRGASKEEEVAKYIQDLKSTSVATRRGAAEEIGKIAQVKASAAQPAVKPLLELLKDKDATVRAAAATSVSRLDAPNDVVPELSRLLKDDKDMRVRIASATGLGLMGAASKDALPTLRSVQKEAQAAGRESRRLAMACGEAMRLINSASKKQ